MSRSRKILVVDDTESNRYAICRYLRRAGFEVLEADNGERALRLAEEGPDLIILDVHLPDCLGYDICRLLKEKPRTSSIPVLEMSAAFRSSADRIKGLESGAHGYLTGPVDPEELIANVGLLLRLRDAEESLRQKSSEVEEAHRQLKAHAEGLESEVCRRTMELIRTNQQLQSEMAERRAVEHSRDSLFRQLVNAEEDQRRRLSRELHDETGQELAALMIGLKRLDEAIRDDAAAQRLVSQLQDLADEIGRKLHRVAVELRPTSLDDIGLVGTLQNYVELWSKRFHIEVDFQSVQLDSTPLVPEIETTLYRIVQEALTNVAKHAKANRVSVIIESRGPQIQLIVEDDGCGFDSKVLENGMIGTGRLGLAGMRERLAWAGGTLNIESNLGKGTTVFARIPLPIRTDLHAAHSNLAS